MRLCLFSFAALLSVAGPDHLDVRSVVGNAQNEKSRNYKIPLPHIANLEFLANDYLYCMVWVCRNGGSSDFPISMWYDGPEQVIQGVKAWSRIHKVTIGGNTLTYYYFRDILDNGYRLLSSSNGATPTSVTLSSATTSFQLLGTWRIVGSNMKNATQSAASELTLENNYPNPFNPTTMISFALPRPLTVSLVVTDALGREVTRLADHTFMQSGAHSVAFDASGIPSGVYFYRLETDDAVLVKKMVVMK